MIREKSFLSYFVGYRISVLFLISVTLVSSSYILPLAYSQEFYPLTTWGKYGIVEGTLKAPMSIAIDQEGSVYVADTANNRIQVFSDNGTFITQWGGYGVDNGSLSYPEGIAVDSLSGNVYVADTANNRIQVFSDNGTLVSKWGGYGISNSNFRSPSGVAIDQEGSVYVADTGNNRIQVFSDNGTFITQWGGYGVDNGSLSYPEGIAVDSLSGNVYVADTANNRIQVFSDNGTFITEWGRYGRAGNDTLRSPTGIAVDLEGNVYVADTGNNRIQVFSNNGTFITQWGRLGYVVGYFRSPSGVAIDQEGSVYVADTANNRISIFTSISPISNVAFSSEDGEIYGNDTKIRIEPVYEGLQFATSIAFLGPDDMLVLQKENNTIVRIVNGQMLDEPVLDLGNAVKINGCMCGIAILQNDDGRSYAFLYYYLAEVTEDDGTTKLVNSLYRYDITDGRFTNPQLIFEMPSSPTGIHHGGKLMVGPDNNIYLTIGDIDGRQTKAQNVKNGSMPDGSSSILRFTPEGEPVDGGLLGDTHPLDKYYAYGLRNSFGMDYDPFTGNIWITDNGPEYGDEINIVRPGFNGGWNKIMGMSSTAFNLTDLEFFNGTGRYYDPIFEWRPSIGITDLAFIPSDRLGNEYEGNLFVGDVNSGYLYRFVLNQTRTGLSLNGSLSDGVANNNIEMLEAVFAKINRGGIIDLEIGPDGLLYIVSAHKIMRLAPAPFLITGN